MRSEQISLIDAVEFIVDNRGKTVPIEESGFPLIATNCISNLNLYPEFTNIRYISQDTFNTWFRAHPEPDDVIITNKGSQNGAICLVPNPVTFVIAQDMVALRAKRGIIFPKYLFAVLRSKKIQEAIKNLNVDSVIPHFKKTDFNKLFLPKPNYEIQKVIGNFYFLLSSKIELNRKMNQTLEEMAQAIFKSWFVDFDPVHVKVNAVGREDALGYKMACGNEKELQQAAKELGISKEILDLFPTEFEESELGMIPKGWEWKKITEVCSNIGSGGTPKRMQDDNFNGGINWFTTKELQNSFVLNSVETISNKGLSTSSAKLFPINTVVMAIYAAPTVGRLGILTHQSTFNQAACGFIADEDNISYEFLFLYLQDKNGYLNNLANGAAQQNLNVGLVKNLDVLIPNKSIMAEFKAMTENIFSQIKNNIYQIQTLQKTRDILLPKLLSGELDVSKLYIGTDDE